MATDSTTSTDDSGHDAPTTDDVLPKKNTVKHWVLYVLDAWEASDDGDREVGATPEDVYFTAGGENTKVFTDANEVATRLTELRTKYLVLDRRTEATTFADRQDADYHYRLNDDGRRVLLDVGRPEKYPARRGREDYDRELPSTPAHRPGWWMDPPPWEVEWEEGDPERVRPDTQRHEALYIVAEAGPLSTAEATDHPAHSFVSDLGSPLNQLHTRKLVERAETPNRSGGGQFIWRISGRGRDALERLGPPSGVAE